MEPMSMPMPMLRAYATTAVKPRLQDSTSTTTLYTTHKRREAVDAKAKATGGAPEAARSS